MVGCDEVWALCRGRFVETVCSLNDAQLQWTPGAGVHSVGEIAMHVAGAEHFWALRMVSAGLADGKIGDTLDRAVYDGFLNDDPVPFLPHELTVGFVAGTLERTRLEVLQLFESPTEDQLSMPISSPLGPMTDGRGGLARMAMHPAYHLGQVQMIVSRPDFPR